MTLRRSAGTVPPTLEGGCVALSEEVLSRV
jgi:hypothetical protein